MSEKTPHQTALDSLERNARVQAQLIDDLLDISRISKGKLRLLMQLVDLRAIVVDTAETMRGAVAKKRLTLTVDAGERCLVLADRARLRQVAANRIGHHRQMDRRRRRLRRN